MEMIMSLVAYFTSHQALIFGVLFGLSEALAAVPAIKANSVFGMMYNFLKSKKTE